MNRVLFLTSVTFSHMGGMEIYNDQLASALGSKLKGQVYMLPVDDATPVKTPAAEYQLVSMALLHQLPSTTLRRHLLHRAAKWLAGRTIASHGIDFILCGYVHLALLAAELSRLHNIPYGLVGHGIEIWGPLAPAKLAALREADPCLAVSHYTADHMLQKGVARYKIHLLPPHIDTDYYRIDKNLGEGLRQKMGWTRRTVMLTVGRLSSNERYKGHDLMMRALASVIPSHPELLYVIAGRGDDLSRLEALSAELRLQDHVHFAGYVPEREKVAYYNACDFFAMVSQTGQRDNRWIGEGFGIVFLEANACGKPVLGPDGGGVVDAVENGYTGILVPADDEGAVARAVAKLASDPAARRRMGAQGRERTVRDFSLAALNKKVDHLLYETSQRALSV